MNQQVLQLMLLLYPNLHGKEQSYPVYIVCIPSDRKKIFYQFSVTGSDIMYRKKYFLKNQLFWACGLAWLF